MSSPPRLSSPFNVTWSIASELATFEGLLADITADGASLTSSICASPGDDVRIEISDDAGAPYRVALARVDAVAGEKMKITFVALGIDGVALEAMQKAPPRKGALPPRLHYGANPRVPPFICLAEVGWLIEPTRSGEVHDGGAHGYDNAAPEMAALFIANGPAFLSGVRLPSFDNVDVYPLLARLVGVTPHPSDGNPATLTAALRRPG